jgi:hypothetical protein
MINRQREFDPQAFHVFGPKIVATRTDYDDKGLESRFITEDMGTRKLRTDVPINLPSSFKEEARSLRNKLLLYRFRNLPVLTLDEGLVDRAIEPRLNQIIVPLLSVVKDPERRQNLTKMVMEAGKAALLNERGLSVEAQVLEVLISLMGTEPKNITVAAITDELFRRYGSEYERPITNRWVGSLLRKRLHLRTYKSHGVYMVTTTPENIDYLCSRYGIDRHQS